MIEKEQFLTKYNINREEFEKSNINWEKLINIYNHYLKYKDELIIPSETIANILRSNPDVHSVRTRIKDPEHLIHKIIRKTVKERKENPDYEITLDNYTKEITDLIGIRVLHLYKDQALNIDNYIRVLWVPIEPCTIYFRKGDTDLEQIKLIDKEKYLPKEHPYGYRSWHYLISTRITRQEHIAEIQVRTIFEEGWSEIDHQLRYPYDIDNNLLTNHLLVLNRLAGSADEMANVIRETKEHIENLNNETDKFKNQIKNLENQIEDLKGKIEKSEAFNETENDFIKISSAIDNIKNLGSIIANTKISIEDLSSSIRMGDLSSSIRLGDLSSSIRLGDLSSSISLGDLRSPLIKNQNLTGLSESESDITFEENINTERNTKKIDKNKD